MFFWAIVAIIATITSLVLFFVLLNIRNKMIDLEIQLESAKRKIMPEDQLKKAQYQIAEDRRIFEQEMEAERQLAAKRSKDLAITLSGRRGELEEILKELGQAQEGKNILEEMLKRRSELSEILIELAKANENKELVDLGFSRQNFTHTDPASYQQAIEDIENKQAQMLKAGLAAKCTMNWTIEGSEKKGEQMIGKLIKLALRTFNADSDAAIAKVKWNNIGTMAERIKKSEETIEKTLDKWGIIIVDSYRDLKLKELRLTFERAELDQRIKEEQKEIREQQREEEKARREAETAERTAEKEERQLAMALEKAKQEMTQAHTADMTQHLMRIKELEIKLASAGEDRQRAVSMAQLTKMGNVYIVSNVGSFGHEVLKIGMTRRMDPMDRIWELSDASVPFDFDVHGMIKTDDAPGLEAKLHKKFEDRRLNLINFRKEFFRVTIKDVQEVVTALGLDVRLTLAAEARELLESEAIRVEKNHL